MRTYVNTSLIDAHNAQMQLEQMEIVRFQRAAVRKHQRLAVGTL